MQTRFTSGAIAFAAALAMSVSAAAQQEFTWQGRLLDGGSPANGVYDFRFGLFATAVGGFSLGPGINVDDVNVVNGLVVADLDFGGGFAGDDRWLQIEVKADADGVYTPLDPRQQILPTPYAHYALAAAGIADGGLPGIYTDSVSFLNPGNQFAGNGSGLTKLNADELLTGNVDAARMPTGGGWSLTSGLNIDGGSFFFDPVANRMGINTTVPGDTLSVIGTGYFSNDMLFGNSGGTHILFDVSQAEIATFNGALPRTQLWGDVWGEVGLWDFEGERTAYLTSDGLFGIGAGRLELFNEDASVLGAYMHGGFGGGGHILLRSSENIATIDMQGEGGTGGTIEMYSDANIRTVMLDSDSAGGALMTLHNAAGITTASFDGDSGSAGFISLNDVIGGNRVTIDGDNGGAGYFKVDQVDNSTGVIIDGDAGTNAGGLVSVHDENSTATIELRGSETGTDGGQITLSNASGLETIFIDGDIGNESRIEMFSQTTTNRALYLDISGDDNGRAVFERGSDSANMVVIDTEDDSGNDNGRIRVFNGDNPNVATITLEGDWNGTGDGRILTSELQITGGADLSEQFDIAAADGAAVEPGMIVCIDPANPGKLVVSTSAYDFTVAGIISGAGGVKPGMLMAQASTAADGDQPVALTGRVYVWCDAANGAIQPGHLLTTSDTPGHAMRATDRDRSHGAIIGKAMTSLDEGTGLVLVLVGLH